MNDADKMNLLLEEIAAGQTRTARALERIAASLEAASMPDCNAPEKTSLCVYVTSD